MTPAAAQRDGVTDPIAQHFSAWRATGHRALIPYITAGYPHPDQTAALLDALAANGADIIELGVPFSDPVADGPTIQRSSQRALEHGTTLTTTLSALRAFRTRHDTPVVIFSYLNPIVRYGVERFITDAVAAGANGVLLTDLPAGCDPALESLLQQSPLSLIRLIAPTTSMQRAIDISAQAQGFLYYIASMGVTGARSVLRQETLAEVAELRRRVSLPVAVGFGVSTPRHAAEITGVADAVIVGSALINALDAGGIPAVATFMGALREGIDAQ
jgi:tryptophan synthase alpha chain